MRFLVRIKPNEGKEKFVETVRLLASSVGTQARNPKWNSKGALEIDIFAQSNADFRLFLSALGPLGELQFVHDLNVAPPFKSSAELYEEARSLFNDERYWEAHEVLEGMWRNLQGKEKQFVQGVILVCAAFVHHQKGEKDVALGVLRRAERQLSFPGGNYNGIDVTSLNERVGGILRTGDFVNFSI